MIGRFIFHCPPNLECYRLFTMEITHNEKLKVQFDLRSKTYERTERWVTDKNLMAAHLKLAGILKGKSLDLCCGTGAVSRELKAKGWETYGIDLSPGMVEQASQHMQARLGDVTRLPYPDRTFDLVIMRQSYFLLNDGPAALKEVRRVLKSSGRFVLSHIVPFSGVDTEHLKTVLTNKETQMKKFFTTELLVEELQRLAFDVVKKNFVTVRESVTTWTEQAPELGQDKRQTICDLVVNSPDRYRKLRNVEVRNGEVFEDWNFVLLLAQPRPM